MPDRAGIAYLRTSRGAMPTLYEPGDTFPIGGSRTVRDGDDVTLAGCGVTVHEALRAAGIDATAIDFAARELVEAGVVRR